MKTIATILAAILILQVNFLFANKDGVPLNTNKEMNISSILISAPVTPKEATFEEPAVAEMIVLAPVTPKEATFEDESGDLFITSLAPVTPAEAGFDYDEYTRDANITILAPVTPAEADFTDLP